MLSHFFFNIEYSIAYSYITIQAALKYRVCKILALTVFSVGASFARDRSPNVATVRPMSRAQLAPTEAAQRVHKRLTKYGRTLRLI